MTAEAAQRPRIRPELAQLSTPIDEVTPHPDNPRRGNVDAIAESLFTHGQYRPIIADERGFVLAGNHTLRAARLLGWTEIAVVFVDVDEDTARRILLVTTGQPISARTTTHSSSSCSGRSRRPTTR